MPIHCIDGYQLNIPRDAILLDTNILVSFFDQSDQNHETVDAFINVIDSQLFITPSAIVEAWGLLSSRKNRTAALQMLSWVITPGNVDIICEDPRESDEIHQIVSKWGVDYVDAAMVLFADKHSKKHSLKPPFMIATNDNRDFYKFIGTYKISLCDMKSGDPIYFEQ